MQTVLTPEHKTGIFIQELKNRFLCEVEIDGESTVCYVPSSCHLSNFLDLKGKSVLLALLSQRMRGLNLLFLLSRTRKTISC